MMTVDLSKAGMALFYTDSEIEFGHKNSVKAD